MSTQELRSIPTIWRETKPGAKEIIEKWRELKVEHGEKDFAAQQNGLREWYATLPAANPSKKLSRYKWVDKWGPWRDRDISWPGGGGPRYDVLHPDTKLPVKIPEAGWRFSSPDEMKRQIDLGLIVFREDHSEPPFRKAHLLPVTEELDVEDALEAEEDTEETEDEDIGLQVMGSVLYKQSQVAVKYLRKLLGGKLFDNPKDHEVLGRLIGYPGFRIPQPLEVTENWGSLSFQQVAADLLRLTKLNWNTAAFSCVDPITIAFSKRVGEILKVADVENPALHYRSYM